MGNGIPDDWYIEHSGEGMILDQEKVAAELNRLRAALKEIQAYSVGDRLPRHTWYYDFVQSVLTHAETPKGDLT